MDNSIIVVMLVLVFLCLVLIFRKNIRKLWFKIPNLLDAGFETHNNKDAPLIEFQITQQTIFGTLRQFPNIGLIMKYVRGQLPVKIALILNIQNDAGQVHNIGGHYSGKELWTLYPNDIVQGQFDIPTEFTKDTNRISAVLNASIVGESAHEQLVSKKWIYEVNKPQQGWWYNP